MQTNYVSILIHCRHHQKEEDQEENRGNREEEEKNRAENTLDYFKLYTDEDLKWDKPPTEVCLLIHLSVTLPLNLY